MRSDTFLAETSNADVESSSISSMCWACFFGITRVCPLVTGNISRNAYVSSSSYTLFDLISPETILQNRQSIISVFVFIIFRFYLLIDKYYRSEFIYRRIGNMYIWKPMMS